MLSTVSQDPSIPAHKSEYAGTAATPDFGDIPAEFDALLSKCGIYEMPWRAKVSLTGADRVRWLNGMITNNVRDLPRGSGVYAFLLNPQGRILGDLYAYNTADSLLVNTDRAQLQRLLEIFDKYIIMDDVEVGDISDTSCSLGVTGPKASAALRSVGLDFPELAPLGFVDVTWQDLPLTVVRGDNPCVESYEAWLPPENMASLRTALVKSGATPVGITALNLLRIACGIPQYGQDIRERDLPQETGQQRALHFTKGCYIGQEIVERIRSRGNVHRMFTGFTVEGPLPMPGTKIHVDGKEAGEITSSASLPLRKGQRSVALGYIRREVAASNRPISIEDTSLRVTDLPFSEVLKH